MNFACVTRNGEQPGRDGEESEVKWDHQTERHTGHHGPRQARTARHHAQRCGQAQLRAVLPSRHLPACREQADCQGAAGRSLQVCVKAAFYLLFFFFFVFLLSKS